MLTIAAGYVILGLSIAAPIGPINIEIIKRGVQYGFVPALLVGAGGISSDLGLMAIMFFGFSSIMQLTWVKISLTLIGCWVLLISGWTNLQSKQDYQQKDIRSPLPSNIKSRSYFTGMTIAASNPMNLLFWLGIYGSVLSSVLHRSNHFQSFFLSSLVFVGIGLWNLNLAFTIHFGRLLMSPLFMKTINIIASFVLIYFGLKFGYMGISELIKVLREG